MPQMNKGGKFIFGQSIIQGQKTRRLRAGVYLFAIMEWVSAIGYRMFPLSDSGYAGALYASSCSFSATYSAVSSFSVGSLPS